MIAVGAAEFHGLEKRGGGNGQQAIGNKGLQFKG